MINRFHLWQTVTSKSNYASAFFLGLISILAYVSLQYPALAFADDDCALSEEDKATYIADGTYDQRVAFQQSLNNSNTQEGLIEQAQTREKLTLSGVAQQSNIPYNWESGMGTTGEAHVLVLYVSFPDYQFATDDTPEALKALFNGGGVGVFPYESLHDYYYRASYGKLDIQATVFSYQAARERGYYTDKQLTLFDEAISALQENGLNLEDYDKNNDGKIDGVYLHFAGGDTGWGSAWWSHEQSVGGAYGYDGKKLWNIVTLHPSSNTERAYRTVIHETGHVLGLPDFYSYNQSLSSDSSGILTSDMMKDNKGDHNAFSKWLLDWIDSNNIIRVVANSSGTKVKKGLGRIEDYPVGTTISETLSSFTAQDVSSCGGFIAVSNDETLLEDKGLFSSFYLLQYDTYAQNQSVMYSYNDGSYFHTLSSGFRVYRIQADLNPTGSDFIKSNAEGTVHDQLIELVDPDGFTESGTPRTHYSSDKSILSSNESSAEGWACMYYQGATLTPTSKPSTNFYENISSGFTGLSLSFTKSETAEGAVDISYTEKDQPVVPDFSISLDEGCELYPQTKLSFTTSTPVSVEPQTGSWAFLYIDGKEYPLEFTLDNETHTKITTSTKLDSSLLKSDSKCSIVFPKDQFLYARTPSQKYVSPEIEIQIPVGSLAKTAANNGTLYGNSTPYQTKGNVSSFFTDKQGTPAFIQRADSKLLLNTVEKNDYSSIESTFELGLDIAAAWETATFKALPLDNGLICVVAGEVTTDGGAVAQHYLWFDPSNNYQLIAEKTVSETTWTDEPNPLFSCDLRKIFSLGSTVITSYYPGGMPGLIIGGFDVSPNSSTSTDSVINEHWIKLDAVSLHQVSREAENETLAIAKNSDKGFTADLILASSFHSALNQGERAFSAAREAESIDFSPAVINTFSADDYYSCNDILSYKGRYFVLASSPTYTKPDLAFSALFRFDPNNPSKPEKTQPLTTMAESSYYRALAISNGGILSVSYSNKTSGAGLQTGFWTNEVCFYDCNFSPVISEGQNDAKQASYFINYSEAYGAWVNDAFCLPGWQDGVKQPLYFATTVFASVQPDWIAQPDPKPDPISPDNPATPNQSDNPQGKSYSAKTGDGTQPLSALLVAISLSSALVLARVSAQFAMKKK